MECPRNGQVFFLGGIVALSRKKLATSKCHQMLIPMLIHWAQGGPKPLIRGIRLKDVGLLLITLGPGQGCPSADGMQPPVLRPNAPDEADLSGSAQSWEQR